MTSGGRHRVVCKWFIIFLSLFAFFVCFHLEKKNFVNYLWLWTSLLIITWREKKKKREKKEDKVCIINKLKQKICEVEKNLIYGKINIKDFNYFILRSTTECRKSIKM